MLKKMCMCLYNIFYILKVLYGLTLGIAVQIQNIGEGFFTSPSFSDLMHMQVARLTTPTRTKHTWRWMKWNTLCFPPNGQLVVQLFSWTWQWVNFTQMASTVTRSQSSRAALGCGGTGDSHHGCTDDKSAETVWCYHVNMDQNLWGMFPTPCWIYATKN